MLIGGDAHHAWMNSAALRALGIPPRDGIVAEEEWFVLAPRLLNPGHQLAFQVGLAEVDRDVQGFRPFQAQRLDIVEGFGPIDGRLTHAQHVEVWAVQDQD